MSTVLIVEDEDTYRKSLARGVSKMDGVTVLETGTVDEALRLIDQYAPDLIISDIDMPERTGLELIGEIGRRGMTTPFIFVSAYLCAYRSQLPPHANIEVLEKPVTLHDIREIVREKLSVVTVDSDPFGAPDLLQLAGMGCRSVVLEAAWADGTTGRIVVVRGEVWDASCGRLPPGEAFQKVAWEPGARLRCRPINDLPARRLEGTIDAYLLTTARQLDESQRGGGSSSEDGALAAGVSEGASFLDAAPPGEPDLSSGGCGPDPRGTIADLLDAQVAALLERDYAAALSALLKAAELDPTNSLVRANLCRLAELGYSAAPASTGGADRRASSLPPTSEMCPIEEEV